MIKLAHTSAADRTRHILQDLEALRNDPLTVDTVITKYIVNLSEFDGELEQS